MEKRLSLPEAAELLGYSYNTTYIYAYKGIIPAHKEKHGKKAVKYWFFESELKEWNKFGRYYVKRPSKNNGAYSIHEWMLKDLSLSGNELLAYAVINDACQRSLEGWTYPLEMMSEKIGCSKQTAQNAVKNLTDKGLVITGTALISGYEIPSYKVNMDMQPSIVRE